MYSLTLTPNRTPGPAIFTRMVLYRRTGNRVEAFQAQERGGQVTVERLAWRDIAACQADPELQQAWIEHVAYQRALRRE